MQDQNILNLSTECEAGHQCTGEGKQLEARIFAMLDALAFKVSLEIGNFLDAQKMIGIHSTYPIVVIQSVWRPQPLHQRKFF